MTVIRECEACPECGLTVNGLCACDTKQNEAPRLIAERLAQNFSSAFRGSYVPSAYRDATNAIEAALNAERERCAKIADKEADEWVAASRNYKASDPMKNTCLSRSEMANELAAAIRGSKSDAE